MMPSRYKNQLVQSILEIIYTYSENYTNPLQLVTADNCIAVANSYTL
jgi:hypothetical protein